MTTAPGRKELILAVDDDPKDLKLLEFMLSAEGYEVTTALSGPVALRRISEREPDLVLLDIMMPEMTGFEVIEKIRAAEKTRLLPVVMITALNEVSDRVTALKAGCDDFISKPFDKSELLARVKSLLFMNYYRRQLAEKEKFEYVLSQMEDGIIVFDKDIKIERLNAAAAGLFSLSGAELDFIGHIQEMFVVRYEGSLREALRMESVCFDLEREATDSVKGLVLEARTGVVRNPASGEIVNVLMLVRDVTEARTDELTKRDFLSFISHKLMTPVAGIGDLLDLIKTAGPSLSERQEKYAGMAANYCQRLTEMIVRLIKFAGLMNSPMTSGREKVLLSEFIPHIMGQVSAHHGGKKVENEFVFANGKDAVMANKYYFGIVLDEIADNALKFSDKDAVKLTIKTMKDADRIGISIKDNGPGIPPEEVKSLFVKFYQIERCFTGNVKGVGLGLAIAKKFVESSGGEIKISSVLGEGTEVIISLPCG